MKKILVKNCFDCPYLVFGGFIGLCCSAFETNQTIIKKGYGIEIKKRTISFFEENCPLQDNEPIEINLPD